MDENSADKEKQNSIENTLALILERIDKLEKKNIDTGVKESAKDQSESTDSVQTTNSSSTAAAAVTDQSAEPSADAIDTSDLQREYWSIKDSVSKVQLNSSLKLNEVTLGLNKKDKPVQKVLQRTSRVLETALKLCHLASSDPDIHHDSETYKYLEQIYIVLQAGIQQNQQEFQSLIVQGQFSEDTAKVFRILQQNKNCFPESAVAQLELAAKLSTMNLGQQQQPQHYNGNHRGRGFRGGYRGRYNNSFPRFQRGGGHNQQDVYRQFNSYSVPSNANADNSI